MFGHVGLTSELLFANVTSEFLDARVKLNVFIEMGLRVEYLSANIAHELVFPFGTWSLGHIEEPLPEVLFSFFILGWGQLRSRS